MIPAPPVLADVEVEELERLDFGTLAIPSNDSVSEFHFPRTGRNITIEGDIILVERGVPGRYLLSGFPPNTSVEVDVDETELTAGGTGAPEALSTDGYDFNELSTNESGEAELQLGGTLLTSGTGESYDDAPYSGGTTLRFHYWSPEAESFVTNSENVELEAAVRTSFNVEQAQALHFGTLFAQAASTDQASLVLSPDGNFSINEEGDARLLSLSSPKPAVLEVSGAAPNQNIQIEPDEDEVLLQHSETPGSAPHFILHALQTDPDETGRTDDNGHLEVHVGGTLSTENTAETVIYPSGLYEGTYEMTLSY